MPKPISELLKTHAVLTEEIRAYLGTAMGTKPPRLDVIVEAKETRLAEYERRVAALDEEKARLERDMTQLKAEIARDREQLQEAEKVAKKSGKKAPQKKITIRGKKKP